MKFDFKNHRIHTVYQGQRERGKEILLTTKGNHNTRVILIVNRNLIVAIFLFQNLLEA